MAFLVKTTLKALQTHLAKTGFVRNALIGEPKSPADVLTAAVFMQSATVTQVMFDGSTVELHTVLTRVYDQMLDEPTEDLEIRVAHAVSQISSNMLGDFDLNSTIRHVDAAGSQGTPFGIQWGYAEIGGVMHRIADITVPMVVDGSAKLVA